MSVSKIQEEARKRQAKASRPDASAWVSANAGSGKTYVLVNRIIRLLLSGSPPERILCLTFTRAAAAEMEARLFQRLSQWINLSDEELCTLIGNLRGEAGWSGSLDVARRLFTEALETPGGLKIQTLHGFCESVLQRFPVEAGIAPGFKVLDERGSKKLMREVREEVLGLAARGEPFAPDAKALNRIIVHAQADEFDKVLGALLKERSPLIAGWSLPGVGHNLKEALFAELRLDHREQTASSIVEQGLAGIKQADVQAAYSAFLSAKGKSARARAQTLGAILEQPDWNSYCGLFLKTNGEPISEGRLATKEIKDRFPAVWDWLLEERERVVTVEDRRKSALTAEASDALFTLTSTILTRFQKKKDERGQLDYDDLVLNTKTLLTRLDSAWVLYRLDGGIDHVLIDEAQDTSPDQWEIVTQLTGEFFSGEGARQADRTLFAVGDHKQSIFSFQGAEPDRFMSEKSNLARRAKEAGQEFEDVRINISFRSTQRVLDVVDKVFSDPLAQKGMASDKIDHQANRSNQAGLVELWPLFEKERREERDFYDPVDRPTALDPRFRLARHIGATIKGWLSLGEQLTSRGRPIVPGDILILVRNRTVLADALVRALQENNIPVAGADRLKINNHIAIMDLVALARVMHLPADDYSLACILKSPLVAHADGRPLDDNDLMKLAPGRKKTLWRALAQKPKYADIAEQLRNWRRQARRLRPFEFFAKVLETDGARQRFAERMGAEVHDPLDEFLSLACEFEREHPPVLHGFIGWLTDADTNIKRDMDHGRNEVRVMTVHGAKGLESNIVILPDTTRVPDARKVSPVLTFNSGVPVWKLAKANRPGALKELIDAAIAKQDEEENRLLYVAMTRACDRLYVCGAEGRGKPKPQCWYELVRQALEPVADKIDGGILRWQDAQNADPEDGGEDVAQTVRPARPDPWMLKPAPLEPAKPRPLAPSRLDLKETAGGNTVHLLEQPAASPVVLHEETRLIRGQMIHRLLQSLPALCQQDRQAAAERFLTAHSAGLSDANRQLVLRETFQLLEAREPALRTLFGASGLAEVPITGRLCLKHETGKPVVISGTIDRLAVTDKEVLFADFKTNRLPPADVDDVVPVYIRQLAAYATVLQSVYPDKKVRAWLVWTASCRAMEIPGKMLETAFI